MAGIYRINRNGRTDWVHVSPNNETIVLRWFGIPDPIGNSPFFQQNLNTNSPDWIALERNGTRFSINEIAAHASKLPFLVTELKIDDVDEWAEVFEHLNEIGEIIPVDRNRRAQSVAIAAAASPIPLTRMRRFYETLIMLNEDGLNNGIPRYLAEMGRSDRLKVIFEESQFHFQKYANEGQKFHDRQDPDWLISYVDSPHRFARCLVARLHLAAGKDSINLKEYGDIRVVDYEISPFRTTGNVIFEDGTSGTSSGSGGLDLLLQGPDGVPVVGEVKAPTDRGIFLALIQSLTYAIELTTPSQMRRLINSYPNNFDRSGTQCDILLIYSKEDSPRQLDDVKALSEQLLSHNSPVAHRVRKIAGVSAKLEGDHEVSLKCEWSYPRGPADVSA